VDWRTYVTEKVAAVDVPTESDESCKVWLASELGTTPNDYPFWVLVFEPITRPFPGVQIQEFALWLHDRPGSYARINAGLIAARAVLEGQVSEEGAIAIAWQNESRELYDPGWQTITRADFYRCAGRG
jgi:hypothetical protein